MKTLSLKTEINDYILQYFLMDYLLTDLYAKEKQFLHPDYNSQLVKYFCDGFCVWKRHITIRFLLVCCDAFYAMCVCCLSWNYDKLERRVLRYKYSICMYVYTTHIHMIFTGQMKISSQCVNIMWILKWKEAYGTRFLAILGR